MEDMETTMVAVMVAITAVDMADMTTLVDMAADMDHMVSEAKSISQFIFVSKQAGRHAVGCFFVANSC